MADTDTEKLRTAALKAARALGSHAATWAFLTAEGRQTELEIWRCKEGDPTTHVHPLSEPTDDDYAVVDAVGLVGVDLLDGYRAFRDGYIETILEEATP